MIRCGRSWRLAWISTERSLPNVEVRRPLATVLDQEVNWRV
jgi:hypothetical protein